MPRAGARNVLGQAGEELAAELLSAKGYVLIAQNVIESVGEIDLLMKDGETVVVVEVKTQSISRHFNPIEKIDHAKQRKLYLLAQIVAARYPEQNIRVDAVTVHYVSGQAKPILTHLENILI